MHFQAAENAEMMLATKGGSNDKSKLPLRVVGVAGTQLGGAFDKSQASVSLEQLSKPQKEKRILKTIIKKVSSYFFDPIEGEILNISSAERYYRRWLLLRKIGVPVVSSMRVLDDERVIMGDMTADGSEFISKETYRSLKHNTRLSDGLSDGEKRFLKIDRSLLKDEVERIFKLAWNNGILFSPHEEEEFSVLVHPDGTWQVLVVDLDGLSCVKASATEEEIKRIII